jgi:pimeloyl-ACP methyl ester carboxylesterase
MGCSSRSGKKLASTSIFSQFLSSIVGDPKEKTEKYFLDTAKTATDELVESLDELLEEESISSFVLAGHSLGGFLAAKYAIKHPEKVEKLILISPVGLAHHPPLEIRADQSQLGWRIRTVDMFWKLNVTPQSFVRILGPKGPDAVKKNLLFFFFSFHLLICYFFLVAHLICFDHICLWKF